MSPIVHLSSSYKYRRLDIGDQRFRPAVCVCVCMCACVCVRVCPDNWRLFNLFCFLSSNWRREKICTQIHSFSIHSIFIHSVFCLTTGPKPPPKRFLHIVRSRASSFKWQYTLLSLRSSSSFLRLLPRLLVTSITPFIFPQI